MSKEIPYPMRIILVASYNYCRHRPPVAEFLHQTNPVDALKQPLSDVGASLDDVVKLLGTKSFGFLDAMKGITIEGVNSLGDGLEVT